MRGESSESDRLALFRGCSSLDLASGDLSGSKRSPEQQGRSVCRRQHGLRFDPSLELFVLALDRVGGAHAAPLAWRQARESEERVASFLQVIGDGAVLEPPFARCSGVAV